ncbi:glycosyltransferase family 2 protein [Rouxiella badensis]|jgi:hypothetical protein|uniref:glycosyltransferase family 2 protein n=1 Tax=Rouxiella badensis TaxID=1646377 RepID=UPI0013EF2291|nr:hypothetical protein [Rouxiella badensis]MCC3733303.1 hypothetical protein [Rouxiella badensis]MCC3758046.1 hypothetical protein [Rouxiella badensis]QII36383.1 hypothetical protein G3M83_01080 [Rouxiella badensis]WAT08727.1 hypothetical protein O1V65_21290 [Rouxiella badensis]
MSSLLLIVLYNKKIEASQTLATLLDSNYQGEIFIFNNGPNSVSLDEPLLSSLESKFAKVHFEQDITNRPLSVMYNDILSLPEYDVFYLFDDDTSIPSDFFETPFTDSDLGLPIIRDVSNNQAFYPAVNDCIALEQGPLHNNDDVISIGSGLIISRSLLDKFCRHKLKPFDERFSLYGVDFSLFRRIRNLKSSGEVIKISIKGELSHSLSRVGGKKSKARELERIIDRVLCKIHYSNRLPILTYGHLACMVLISLLKFDFKTARVIIMVIRDKCHPRSKKFKFRW